MSTSFGYSHDLELPGHVRSFMQNYMGDPDLHQFYIRLTKVVLVPSSLSIAFKFQTVHGPFSE